MIQRIWLVIDPDHEDETQPDNGMVLSGADTHAGALRELVAYAEATGRDPVEFAIIELDIEVRQYRDPTDQTAVFPASEEWTP